jgi:hypothetical protein
MMSQVIVAVDQSVVSDIFMAAESGFVTVLQDTKVSGALTVSYDIGVQMKGGTLAFTNANTLNLTGVNVIDNPCSLTMTIVLPNLCTPAVTLFGHVIIPSVCLFTSQPVIDFNLNLQGFLDVNLTLACGLGIRHYNNPGWTAGMSDMDAYKALPKPVLNQWQIYPVIPNNGVNVQISLQGSLAAALDGAINAAVANLVGTLQPALQPIAWLLIGPVLLFVDAVVGIGADVTQWVLSLLVGLFDLAAAFQTPIAQYFASKVFVPIDDPFPINFKDPALPLQAPNPPAVAWNPLFVSFQNPTVTINATEMVVTSDIA